MREQVERIRKENMKQYGFGVEAMQQIKVCGECGTTAKSTQSFCTACGHRLPDKTLYDIYKERHKCCPTCDTVVADESDYCPQCGRKLKNDTFIG